MILISIGVFIMAIAFALISIYIARILLMTSKVISTLGNTVKEIESKTEKITLELGAIIEEMEFTAADVNAKLVATEGLFLSVKNVGVTTEIISGDIHNRTERYSNNMLLPGTKPFIHAIQIAELGLGIVRSWNRGRIIT